MGTKIEEFALGEHRYTRYIERGIEKCYRTIRSFTLQITFSEYFEAKLLCNEIWGIS